MLTINEMLTINVKRNPEEPFGEPPDREQTP